ncbi:MAG TPA: IPT/TIG domain-containing protein [Candidatus Paceibacterota bacterium]
MKKFILVGLLMFSFVILPVVGVAESEIERAINNLVSSGSISKQQAEETRKILGLPVVSGTYTAGGSSFCYNWTRNLPVGSTGPDVEALNEALSQEGIADRILSARSYYDEATASNVTRFQEKYRSEILTPSGFSSGTGNVGPATRAKLNQLYACGTLQAQPLQSSIIVTSPNGGETFTTGSNVTIRWDARNISTTDEFFVTYRKDSGYTLTTTIGRTKGSSINWVVPTVAGKYKVTVQLISKPTLSDSSDNWFTVAVPTTTPTPPVVVTPTISSLSPSSGAPGTVVTIYGTGFSASSNVVYLRSASTNYTLSANSSNGTSLQFVIPSWASGQYTILVENNSLKLSGGQTLTVVPAPTVTTSYTLTTNVTGAGSVSGGGVNCGYGIGSSCTKSLSSGTQVTLSASPYSGYVFSGWSGACSGTGSCSITFDSNKSVSATFSTQTQSVTTPPMISSLSPASGPVGTVITVMGSNFTVGNNMIWLRGGTTNYSTTVNSTNGTSVQYTVPSWATGTYTVSIERNDLLVESNTKTFTVTVPQGQASPVTLGNVSLASVVLDGGFIKARYSNRTGYSVHLVSEATGQIIGSVSFGLQGDSLEGSYSNTGTNIKIGDRVKVCHGNDYGICSAVVAVTGSLSRGLVDFQKASVFQILREVLGL